jgi:hypothetical protein
MLLFLLDLLNLASLVTLWVGFISGEDIVVGIYGFDANRKSIYHGIWFTDTLAFHVIYFLLLYYDITNTTLNWCFGAFFVYNILRSLVAWAYINSSMMKEDIHPMTRNWIDLIDKCLMVLFYILGIFLSYAIQNVDTWK